MLYRMSSSRAGIPVSPVGYAGFQDLLEDSLHNLMENKVFFNLGPWGVITHKSVFLWG